MDTVALREIPEGTLHARVLSSGRRVVIAREGREVRVFHESCPHMGADLAEAKYCKGSGEIRCRWHGYLFDRDGKFLENPNEKDMKLLRVESEHYKPGTAPKYRLTMLHAEVRGDQVEIGGAS